MILRSDLTLFKINMSKKFHFCMIFPAKKFVLSMIIRIYVPSVLAKPLNNAQIVRGVFLFIHFWIWWILFPLQNGLNLLKISLIDLNLKVYRFVTETKPYSTLTILVITDCLLICIYVCPTSAHWGFQYGYRRYKDYTFISETTLFCW